ncbi:MAG: molybdopterin-binding protein [Desulfitobacteriia bacterium]|jgi:molybdenum cofactor synthesis domain-containing protein
MRKVAVQDAIGLRLCHDITKMVPGEFKGPVFKKNHLITAEDVEELLNLGKENVYVWEENAGEIHEDDAAIRIAKAVSGENIVFSEPQEGKTVLESTVKGLFKLKSSLLYEINSIEDVTVPSIPNNFKVNKGQKIAAARIVPLVTKEENIEKVEQLCALHGPVFKVEAYKKIKVGIIITGSEVFKGRIKDKFGPVIKKKLNYYGAEILGQTYCPDKVEVIKNSIFTFKEKGAEMIIITGGMSVDPDDLTPGAIRSTGAEVIIYGVPVQPGNMFMLAYLDGVPLLGVPGAAAYFKTTVFDVVLPKIFAGETLNKNDFIRMGEGGLCLNCQLCQYPNCYFCR